MSKDGGGLPKLVGTAEGWWRGCGAAVRRFSRGRAAVVGCGGGETVVEDDSGSTVVGDGGTMVAGNDGKATMVGYVIEASVVEHDGFGGFPEAE